MLFKKFELELLNSIKFCGAITRHSFCMRNEFHTKFSLT